MGHVINKQSVWTSGDIKVNRWDHYSRSFSWDQTFATNVNHEHPYRSRERFNQSFGMVLWLMVVQTVNKYGEFFFFNMCNFLGCEAKNIEWTCGIHLFWDVMTSMTWRLFSIFQRQRCTRRSSRTWMDNGIANPRSDLQPTAELHIQ